MHTATYSVTLFEVRSVNDFVVPGDEIDVFDLRFASLGIAEARALRERAYQRPTAGGPRLIVLRAGSITEEAQNALLKLFEEPPAAVRLVLVVPIGLFLLPTLRSRLLVEQTEADREESDAFTQFTAASYAARLSQIDAATKQKDALWVESIKRGLTDALATGQYREQLRVVEPVVTRLQTRGASNKMLLEQLALVLPVRRVEK